MLNAISGLRIDLTAVTDETIVPVEKLMSEAYQEIDKAVGKVPFADHGTAMPKCDLVLELVRSRWLEPHDEI